MQPESEDVERAILRYLAANPDAKDTLEGIAEWWLVREWAARQLPMVLEAVQDLLSRGLLVQITIGRHPPTYKLNHDRLAEIVQMTSEPDQC